MRADAWHTQRLAEEASAHEKERSALKTILEQKMRVCAEEIVLGMNELVQSGVQVPSKVGKQARALQNLISATAAAVSGGQG